jgi:hypothetical protein
MLLNEIVYKPICVCEPPTMLCLGKEICICINMSMYLIIVVAWKMCVCFNMSAYFIIVATCEEMVGPFAIKYNYSSK